MTRTKLSQWFLKFESFCEKYNIVLSFVIGVILVFVIIPPAQFLATPSDWHSRANLDFSMNLNGFLYFWNEPWRFPLLSVNDLGIPFGFNIFYTDSYPLAAILAKLLPLASAPNIYPACIALSVILQTVAGTSLGRSGGLRGPVALMAGIFFTFTPYFLFRFGHVALLNHWLILAALAEAFRHQPTSVRRLILLSAIAFLTHAYLWAMVFPIFLVVAARAALERPSPFGRLARAYGLAGGLFLGLAYAIGLIGQGAKLVIPDNFGEASLNMLSPIAPQHSGLFRGRAIIDATGYQYEGYAYLGLGSLILIGIALILTIRKRPRLSPASLYLSILLLGFFIFALSNKIYIGQYLILNISLPSELLNIVAQLRNSGRFFWPVGYALVAVALFTLARQCRPAVTYGLLLTLLAVQIIDAGPTRKIARREVADQRAPLIDAATWERHFADSRRLIIAPPFGCAPMPDWPAIVDIQNRAAEAYIPINSLYGARSLKTCEEMRDATLSSPPVPGTTYVLIGDQTGPTIRAALDCYPLQIPRRYHKMWLPHAPSGATEFTLCRANAP